MRHWEKKGLLLEYRNGFLFAVHPSESIGYKLKLQMNTFDKVKQEYDVKAKWSCLVLGFGKCHVLHFSYDFTIVVICFLFSSVFVLSQKAVLLV